MIFTDRLNNEALTIYKQHFILDKKADLFEAKYLGLYTKLELIAYYCETHKIPYFVVSAINHNRLWFNLISNCFLAVRSDIDNRKYHIFDNTEF